MAERPPITFDDALQPQIEQDPSELDLERERHKARAEKFGVEFVDPAKKREYRDAARRERIGPREAIGTGFDLFSQEEQQKIQQRAARFGGATGLQWQPPQEDEEELKRRQRAEKYGTEYQPKDETGLMDVDLYEERKEVPAEIERRTDAIHVYGVDLMSTGDILKYFAEYGPTFVEWLNDSSCNVQFRDASTAKRAIAGLGKPLPSDELPQGVDTSDASQLVEYLWHKGPDFVKAGGNIPLIFRIATVLDVKPSERVQSRRLWQSVPGGGRGSRRGGIKKHRGQQQKRPSFLDRGDHFDEDMEGDDAMNGQQGGRNRKGRGRRMFRGGNDDEMDMGGDGSSRARRKAGLDGSSWAFKATLKTLDADGKAVGVGSGDPAVQGVRETEMRQAVDYGDL